MNDIELLREMRADAPEPGFDRLAAGRERLRLAAVPGRDGHRRTVTIFATGMVAAVTAAAAVVVVSERAPSVPPVRPAIVRLLSVTQVLDKAAAAAASRPATMPKRHQWVYVKGVKSPPDGLPAFVMSSWTRFDGQESATIEHGKLVFYPGLPQDAKLLATPQAAAGYLASLPATAHGVLAAIYHKADTQPRDQWASPDRDARAYSILMTLLWNALVGVPPAHQAAAFRAMAQIPGVTVRTGLVDAAGRPAIGLSFRPGNGLTGYFLLDPHTYAVSGLSYNGSGAARITLAVVNRPGQT
jgi:hypothetical protein